METLLGDQGLKYLSAALAVGLSALGTAKAQGSIGAAAMGGIAENENLFTKAIVFIALPETALILGFVIAILLLFM
jgi:V/A-type H+-transporting ATPase subunit K